MLGTIANEIEDTDEDLRLRFGFVLIVLDVEPGSAKEHAYADGMNTDYLNRLSARCARRHRVPLRTDPS